MACELYINNVKIDSVAEKDNNSIMIYIKNFNCIVNEYIDINIMNPVNKISRFNSRFKINNQVIKYDIFTVNGGLYNGEFYNYTHLYDTKMTVFKKATRIYKIVIQYIENNSKNYLDNFKMRFGECQVCYEDKNIYQIHRNFDHSFCKDCLSKLETCPVCREQIKK
jgi:hypothetical protein